MSTVGPSSRHSRFLRHIIQYYIVTCCVVPIIVEVADICLWWRASNKYPKLQYSSFYLGCALVPIWRGFSAIMPPSTVARFASALEATYDSVRSAGTKAMAYALADHRF
jgi:hypothetical protein